MQRTSQSRRARPRVRRGPKAGDGALALADLEARFAQHRKQRPRGSRVPEELRAAALSALDEGLAPGDLYRRCGISSTQIATWKAGHGAGRVERRCAEAADVRVFSVVDEVPRVRAVHLDSVGEHELELRLGPWSVRVRLAGSADQERG